ncbi:AAEL002806-PA [Aedes aegypti]|uniref:AAEL002806-PA n=1 Tax=Aedes aegypti TaxID=7159 RepID=Q17H19_AEDAE|nr:AAEL002806-PA [Aedes aegypti]
MATRLATQRSFITVTPIANPIPTSPTTTVAAPVTSSPSPVGATGGGSPSSVDTSSIVVTSPTAVTPSITAIPTAALKNGTGKSISNQSTVAASAAPTTPTVIPTSLIANNLSIANLLGTANGSLTLQQIIQQCSTLQKKIVIHPNGTVIDIVPIDEADSPEDSKVGVQLAVGAESAETAAAVNGNGQQHVTAQVAVVQAQSPNDGGPQYITVTGSRIYGSKIYQKCLKRKKITLETI